VGDAKSASNYQTALRAQRLLGLLAFSVAPAVAAGLISANHLESLGKGAIIAVAILAASLLLERERLPLHLMPLATLLIRVAVPVVGIGTALLVFSLAGDPVAVPDVLMSMIGAWCVTAFGVLLTGRFDNSRQVRVAMIGAPGLAIGMSFELAAAGIRSYQVVGWISDEAPAAEPHNGPHWLGCLDDVRSVVQENSIELLVHSNQHPHLADGRELSRLDVFELVAGNCLDLPVRMIEAGQLYEDLLAHVPLGQSNAAWFQYLMHPRYRAAAPASKRIFDLVVGSAMLLIAAPVLAVCAVAVKLTDGGPIFYRQRRVGEGGREFEIVKLRSMRVVSEEDGARWAEEGDDRVTAIGAFMRRLHLDEMPQLWNILRGDMTVVGPRPERPELIVNLEAQLPYYDRRHLVKPGLAGWAQACCGYGGSEQGSGWKLCHDLYYLKHRSVYFDFLVLIENVRVSLAGVQFGLDAPQEQFILGNAGDLR
jgi:lipopolysaccharide/colanic/teichoic acid biosynthesis glycosyltransferase